MHTYLSRFPKTFNVEYEHSNLTLFYSINLPIVVAGHNKNTYEKDIVFNNPSFGDYDFAIIIV